MPVQRCSSPETVNCKLQTVNCGFTNVFPGIMPLKRVHVLYSGTVQGVGFRYTVQEVASGLGLTGWVKNLRNGSVEVAAEGGEADLRELIARIDRALGYYVRSQDVSWSEATGEFDVFNIRFD